MATLEDKILGEKLHYYCSSSEGEDSDSDASNQDDGFDVEKSKQAQADRISEKVMNDAPRSHNTGIKGVKEDARIYQRYILEKEQERIDEMVQIAERFSLQPEKQISDDELDSDDDDFMKAYRQKRLTELKEAEKQPIFGNLLTLNESNYCEVIDNAPPMVNVIVYIYEDYKAICKRYLEYLTRMAQEFVYCKICCIKASQARMSANFIEKGLPAFLLYRGGNVIKTWVSISEELGHLAEYDEVLESLQEHHILPYS